MNENNIIGVILAGGKSRRFGADKSTVRLGKKNLLEHTIEKLHQKFSEILVVTNNKNIKTNKKNVFFINDCIKGQLGPLVGVLSAMKWIEKQKKLYTWIASFPCDTPFFNVSVIEEIIKSSKKKPQKLYFLKSKNIRHNIFGLWPVNLKKILEQDIRNDYRKVEEWADKIGLETINVSSKKFGSFLNINTRKDFEEAKKKINKL